MASRAPFDPHYTEAGSTVKVIAVLIFMSPFILYIICKWIKNCVDSAESENVHDDTVTTPMEVVTEKPLLSATTPVAAQF